MTKSKIVRAALCGVAISASTTAFAQDQAATETVGPGTEGVADIVVTAQRRSQSINSVPLTVTAVSGEQLVEQGVRSADDLVKIVPALTVAKSQNNTPVYTLRGVGFQTQNMTSTSPVGVYVDEVAYAYPYLAGNVAFDLDRVEALKGPQGTLYGRSTTGGVINFITAKPETTPSGSLTFGAGNYGAFGVQGHATGPITGTLSYRVAGDVDLATRGWQHSVTRSGDRLGERNRKAVRGMLQWQPSSAFDTLLTASYWQDLSDTQAPQAIAYTPQVPPFSQAPRAQPSIIAAPSSNRLADWTPFNYRPVPGITPRPDYGRMAAHRPRPCA